MEPTSNFRGYLLRALADGLAVYGWSLDDLSAGCPECPHASRWDVQLLWNYAVAFQLVDALVQITGEIPTMRGAYRCGPCNHRRGGVDGSRHKGGREGGKPMAAFDLDWSSPDAMRKVVHWISNHGGYHAFGDLLRSWTKLDVDAGIIVYGRTSTGYTVHADARTNGDWLDIRTEIAA